MRKGHLWWELWRSQNSDSKTLAGRQLRKGRRVKTFRARRISQKYVQVHLSRGKMYKTTHSQQPLLEPCSNNLSRKALRSLVKFSMSPWVSRGVGRTDHSVPGIWTQDQPSDTTLLLNCEQEIRDRIQDNTTWAWTQMLISDTPLSSTDPYRSPAERVARMTPQSCYNTCLMWHLQQVD